MSTSNTLAISVEEFLRDFTRELEEENAAIFAVQILSTACPALRSKLKKHKKDQAASVQSKSKKLKRQLSKPRR